MITVTAAAVARIRDSARESGLETAVLRVAAREGGDGTVEFGMGFDQSRPGDQVTEVDGVYLVVAPASADLLEGVRLDFVEIEPGDFRFVFAPVEGGEPA